MRSEWMLGLVAMVLSCSGVEIAPPEQPSSGEAGSRADVIGAGGPGEDAASKSDVNVAAVMASDASSGSMVAMTIDPTLAARYPSNQVHAPLTQAVAKRLLSIAASKAGRDDHLATRFGDFNYKIFPDTAASWWWGCLDPKSGKKIQWGSHGALQAAVDFFAQGMSGGASTFYHDAVSCIEGGTAKDELSPSGQFAPSLLEYEIAHSNARYGLVMHGLIETMYFGAFGEDVWQAELEIIDRLIASGVIPIVLSPPMVPVLSGDSAPLHASHTVDTILRGMAEGRQVPFASRLVALQNSSPAYGVGYGPHLDTYINGKCEVGLPGPNNCDFTDTALKCGMDTSILVALEALDPVRRVVVDHAAAPDPNPGPVRSGQGTASSPFEIEGLPYTQMTDLAVATDKALSSYESCGGGPSESGAEQVYHLKVAQNTPVRYFGINPLHNDRKLSVHHLKGTLTAGSCVDSTTAGSGFNHATVLGPGDHYFVVDGASGGSKAELLFGIVACDADDTHCK